MLMTKPDLKKNTKLNYNESNQSSLLYAANLKSEADIDAYVSKLKQKLYERTRRL